MPDRIVEATRWLSAPEPPSSSELLDQYVQTLLYAEYANADRDVAALLTGLREAHFAALVSEDEDAEIQMVEEDDAERVMRRAFTRMFRKVCSPESDEEHAQEHFTWPEPMLWTGIRYPKALLTEVGRALGYASGARTMAWYEHCRKEEARHGHSQI